MTDEWRPIPGYEGVYEASSAGQVRSVDRFVAEATGPRVGFLSYHPGRVLAPRLSKNGYFSVRLRRASKEVHRLVCLAFHGAPSFARAEAAHRNGVRADNRSSNLYWATPQQNRADAMRHGTLSRSHIKRMGSAKARQIRSEARTEAYSAIASRHGVSRATVSDIAKYRTHRSAGE